MEGEDTASMVFIYLVHCCLTANVYYVEIKFQRERYFLRTVTTKRLDQSDGLRTVNEHSNVFLNFRVSFLLKTRPG